VCLARQKSDFLETTTTEGSLLIELIDEDGLGQNERAVLGGRVGTSETVCSIWAETFAPAQSTSRPKPVAGSICQGVDYYAHHLALYYFVSMDSSRSFGRYKRPLGAVVVFGLILVGLLSFGPPSSTYSTYLPTSSHPTTLSAEDLDRALGALKGPTSPAELPVGVPSSSEEQPKEEKAAVVVKPDRSKVRCALYVSSPPLP
jgi:hypothetical protein